jgi:hypothetical protein
MEVAIAKVVAASPDYVPLNEKELRLPTPTNQDNKLFDTWRQHFKVHLWNMYFGPKQLQEIPLVDFTSVREELPDEPPEYDQTHKDTFPDIQNWISMLYHLNTKKQLVPGSAN